MFKFLTLLFFVFVFKNLYAQSINKKYIDEWLMKCDSEVLPKKINLYLIDGVPFGRNDTLKMNDSLKHWTPATILTIDYYKTDDLNLFVERPGYLILISSKGKQKNKEKRKTLKLAHSKYLKPAYYENHISVGSAEPVLAINDKVIFHANCYQELSKIKINNIYAIGICKHAVPSEYYGQNAKNGLIQIWTYPDKNNSTIH